MALSVFSHVKRNYPMKTSEHRMNVCVYTVYVQYILYILHTHTHTCMYVNIEKT